MQKMKYFVTGGTGFIGGRVVKSLLSAGHSVHVLARTPHKALDLRNAGAIIFRGDVTDKSSMVEAMDQCNGIFHIAADTSIGPKNGASMIDTNVRGTHNVLSLMSELQISKGVYTSTTWINSNTSGVLADETYYNEGLYLSDYEKSKWEAHYNVARSFIFNGLPLVIVMPSLVYGPGDHSPLADSFTSLLRGRLPFLPSGTSHSWAHVKDVVRGHILAMEKGTVGESYILGGPTHSIIDVFDVAANMSRRRRAPIHLPPAIIRFFASVVALSGDVLPIPSYYSSESLRLNAGTTYVSTSEKAVRELGYSHRSIESGLKDYLVDIASRISRERLPEESHRS